MTFGLMAQSKSTYVYAIKGLDTLKLDVYTPKNIKKTEALPVLLWAHGGGFVSRDRAHPEDKRLVEYVAKHQNYIGVSIDYRLLRQGKAKGFGCDCPKAEKLETFKQTAIDFMDAAKFLVDNAQQLQIDPTKIIAGGSSAGAEVALNAVFMRYYFLDNAEFYDKVNFAGVFTCAGAVVDVAYITKENALPTVLYHGTKDQLIPYDVAPHHYCAPTKAGYIILYGSNAIAKKLDELVMSFYLHSVKEGGHEISAIPFGDLEHIFNFFRQAIFNQKFIQTKIEKRKK